MLLCEYCGDIADARDHITPCQYKGRRSLKDPWVWACLECNSLLGDKLLLSVDIRSRYLFDAYIYRYKKLLHHPDWSQDELNELSPTLRDSIENSLRHRDIIRERIKYLRRRKDATVFAKSP